MRQYKTIITAAFAALMCTGAFAQNLNPTVEVSRAYEGKLLEMDKPQMRMNVPDSLLKVDLDFDYAVFETPYKGAYEFKPYIMDMKPQPDAYTGRNLYLRAGAGYQFAPEFTGVYSPTMKGAFQMSLYGMHNGFFGKFKGLELADEDGIHVLNKSGNKFAGHDMSNRFGISARADWESSILTFDASYRGIGFAYDEWVKRAYNGVDLSARLRSNDYRSSYFLYDVAVGARLGADKFDRDLFYNLFPSAHDATKLNENIIDINSTFGPVIDISNRVLVDVDITVANYGSFFKSHGGVLAVTPKYEFDHDRFDLSLGLRLSSLIRGNDEDSLFENHSHKGQNVYPVATVSFEAIDERLVLYSELKGGETLNTYSSIIEQNHTFTPDMAVSGSGKYSLIDNTVERFNVNLGAKGNIAQKFQYDLKTGFVKYANGLLEGAEVSSEIFRCQVAYVDYNMAYTDLKFAWNPGNFEIDGGLGYKYTNLSHKHSNAFAPAKLAGNFSMKYNWNDRIHAGIYMAGQTARKHYAATSEVDAKVRGFVDLGLLAQYQYNRKLAFYLQGANLLDMAIQRNLAYPGPGINFTAGICLSL